MLNKIDSMYKIGIRYFAIFFDDLNKEQNGTIQANFLNKIQTSLDKKYVDLFSLITVPTEYTKTMMMDKEGHIKNYTSQFSAKP